MNKWIPNYGLVLLTALLSIWVINQLPSKNNSSPDRNPSDSNYGDATLVSGGDLGARFAEAPTSRALGVFSLSGDKIIALADDKHWPIASLTKLMTALVAFSEIENSGQIKITKEMIDTTDGSAGDFKESERYSTTDLEKALLAVSSNVAAEALASTLGRDKFLSLMADYASRIGLKDTRFVDPTGLSIGNQSTIQDLVKLVRYIFAKQPAIFEITREPSVLITDLASKKSRTLKNINQFAGRADFIGGKTGTTPEAVQNLISVFRGTGNDNGFIIVLLGTEDRFNETQKLLDYALARRH